MNHQHMNDQGIGEVHDMASDMSCDITVIAAAADRAGRMIPPAWPLAATVAVNPFLGHSHEPLETAAARLARISTVKVTMPRQWYRDQIAAGTITDDDLRRALEDAGTTAASAAHRPRDLQTLKAALERREQTPVPLPTVAELARKVSGIDWPGIIAERFGAWAGGYFDEGQALWRAAQGTSAFAAWRAHATHDLTPEILGLKGFANHVDAAAARPLDAIHHAVARLSLAPAALDSYFHQLLLTLTGWAQYARYRLWNAELEGGGDETLTGFLAARLIWETALFARYRDQVIATWAEVCAAHAAPVAPSADHVLDAVLQSAFEHARQRGFAATLCAKTLCAKTLAGPHGDLRRDAHSTSSRPRLQAAFCIDVRSEVYRRALESQDAAIRTIGFAGFFGLPIAHRRFASDLEERRLPVLLKPAQFTCTGGTDSDKAEQSVRIRERAVRAWGRFKLAAVSSFAFVEAAGPLYGPELLWDSFSLRFSRGTGKPGHNSKKYGPKPRYTAANESAEDGGQRAQTAANILRAMSMTEGFARLVVLAGHGAQVANNPHASALHCGACGGYPGDVNARLLAALLNDPAVRRDLVGHGIAIPTDTLFVGALHNTTADHMTLFVDDQDTSQHKDDIAQARAWFDAAGRQARGERALRLPNARTPKHVEGRSHDWAETRPEWGLANCGLFVAAPRARTAGTSLSGTSLAGRAFLHDYDWRKDPEFNILTLILTAPVIVASWISLQYYGSTVAPQQFGAGNKVLHNVVGGFGVYEGNGGGLRAGLPWQSVHDGVRYAHEPLRLSVYVQAPRDAIAAILARHPEVRALFDNRWLHLFALDDAGDDAGETVSRYQPGGDWAEVPAREQVPHARDAADLPPIKVPA